MFTENETNTERAFNQPNQQPYKDGIIHAVVHGNRNAINPELRGTKASAHYQLEVAAKGSQTVRVRLTDRPPDKLPAPFGRAFAATFKARRAEADAFYEAITPGTLGRTGDFGAPRSAPGAFQAQRSAASRSHRRLRVGCHRT